MEKGKLRVSPKLIALLLAGGVALTPVMASGVTNDSYEHGTFVRWVEQVEENEYGEYIVKEGDNLSRISEKICSHLRIEITPKYWPVLAYLNHYPRVITPGEIIIFPKNAEDLILLNDKLQASGWTSKYKQANKVYGVKEPKKALSMEAASKLLYEIYGDTVCIDEDFVRRYLKIQGLDEKYYLTTTKGIDSDTYFELTDWIPTLDELEVYKQSQLKKTKKK